MTNSEPIHTFNVTNTIFTLSGVSYNDDITIFLTAINCAGTSSITVCTLNIGMFSSLVIIMSVIIHFHTQLDAVS
jgi:hypothetical protein